MYIMTKRRRIRQKRKTRKLFKFIKRRRGRMKKRAKKFRRTFRKRRKQLNLRFKSLRRGGAKTSTKRSVHAAAAAKKTATKLHKKAKVAASHANKENAHANKKRKEANAATTKAASANADAKVKATKDPTSASARKAVFRAKQAKKKAQQKQNVASKATTKATKATAKATKATAKATKATAKAAKATAKVHHQSTKQTKKAPRMKPKAQAPAPAPVSFKAGDKVIVQGLKGRSDLNGKQGTIKSKSKKPGLYTVDLNVKTGAKPPGTGCKTASDCKSYHCKNSICAPGSTQIDIKPTNIKLVSAPRKAHSAPKPKDLCKPFTITNTPCSALKSQFQKDVRLCHPDQNKGPNAVLDFQTLHTNYAAQKQWCDKGGKGGRPAPQGKDEWNCAQNPTAKWNKATKKCVVEKKSHTKGNQPCKTDKECHSGSCVSKKCLPQISVGKPCKKSKNCLSANCYVDTDGKAVCKQGTGAIHSSCTNSEQCFSNACAGASGKRRCVPSQPKPKTHKPSLGGSTLSAAVTKGETKLPVADSSIFHKGDVVRIGSAGSGEVRSVIGHGSIILNSPLISAHPQGTPVTIIEHAHAPKSAAADAKAKAAATAKTKAAAAAKAKAATDAKAKAAAANAKAAADAKAATAAKTKVQKKRQGENCANNAACASNVCDITLHTCSTAEAQAALLKQKQTESKPASPVSRVNVNPKEKVTFDVALTPAAQNQVLKKLSQPADSQGNRIVILKITGEQIGPSGAGQAVVRASGGLSGPVAVAATDNAVRK